MDGKKISEELKHELSKLVSTLSVVPTLGIVYVGKNPAIERFVERKIAFGNAIGVQTKLYRFDDTITTEALVQKVELISKTHDGIIIQLPLPNTIDQQTILNLVPVEKDVDVLSDRAKDAFAQGRMPFLPAVPGAIRELINHYHISLSDKKIVIVGRGNLVGVPVATWLKNSGYVPEIADTKTNLELLLPTADVIISGVGKPELITSAMIKPGAVIIDAGTSESAGVVSGDVAKSALDNASFATPVPGGVGPVTVAIIFKNLLSKYA